MAANEAPIYWYDLADQMDGDELPFMHFFQEAAECGLMERSKRRSRPWRLLDLARTKLSSGKSS